MAPLALAWRCHSSCTCYLLISISPFITSCDNNLNTMSTAIIMPLHVCSYVGVHVCIADDCTLFVEVILYKFAGITHLPESKECSLPSPRGPSPHMWPVQLHHSVGSVCRMAPMPGQRFFVKRDMTPSWRCSFFKSRGESQWLCCQDTVTLSHKFHCDWTHTKALVIATSYWLSLLTSPVLGDVCVNRSQVKPLW